MPNQKPKATTRGDRIQAYCTLIWGESEYGYDIPVETDDYVNYQTFIRKDFGLSYGDILMASDPSCGSANEAYAELESKLAFRCKHNSGGQSLSREEYQSRQRGEMGENAPFAEKFAKALACRRLEVVETK